MLTGMEWSIKKTFEPDIPFSSKGGFNNIPEDEKFKEALKWLKKNIKN